MNQVEFNQHAPESYSVIGHPTEKEREHYDGDRFGDSGPPLRVIVVIHASQADETQKEHIANSDYKHGEYKSYKDFLEMI